MTKRSSTPIHMRNVLSGELPRTVERLARERGRRDAELRPPEFMTRPTPPEKRPAPKRRRFDGAILASMLVVMFVVGVLVGVGLSSI